MTVAVSVEQTSRKLLEGGLDSAVVVQDSGGEGKGWSSRAEEREKPFSVIRTAHIP